MAAPTRMLLLTLTLLLLARAGAGTKPKRAVRATSSVLARYSQVGCFVDPMKPRNPSERMTIKPAEMTIAGCYARCRNLRYKFFELHFGIVCYCSNGFSERNLAHGSRCNVPCSGNQRSVCGGLDHFSLYSVGRFRGWRRLQRLARRKPKSGRPSHLWVSRSEWMRLLTRRRGLQAKVRLLVKLKKLTFKQRRQLIYARRRLLTLGHVLARLRRRLRIQWRQLQEKTVVIRRIHILLAKQRVRLRRQDKRRKLLLHRLKVKRLQLVSKQRLLLVTIRKFKAANALNDKQKQSLGMANDKLEEVKLQLQEKDVELRRLRRQAEKRRKRLLEMSLKLKLQSGLKRKLEKQETRLETLRSEASGLMSRLRSRVKRLKILRASVLAKDVKLDKLSSRVKLQAAGLMNLRRRLKVGRLSLAGSRKKRRLLFKQLVHLRATNKKLLLRLRLFKSHRRQMRLLRKKLKLLYRRLSAKKVELLKMKKELIDSKMELKLKVKEISLLETRLQVKESKEGSGKDLLSRHLKLLKKRLYYRNKELRRLRLRLKGLRGGGLGSDVRKRLRRLELALKRRNALVLSLRRQLKRQQSNEEMLEMLFGNEKTHHKHVTVVS